MESSTVADVFWIFGYGSLIWKQTFPFVKKVNGYIKNYRREFWQGSTDHRGVPEAPGRVVTLVDDTGSIVWGTAFCIKESDREEVINYLDFREKGGYTQASVDVFCQEDERERLLVSGALIYLANDQNPHYLGPAPVEHIAQQIAVSVGPSGKNSEYLFNLALSIREMKVVDSALFDLEAIVQHMLNKNT